MRQTSIARTGSLFGELEPVSPVKPVLLTGRARKRQLIINRSIKLKEKYQKLCSLTTESGVQKYSNDYIMYLLEEEFFIVESSIIRIIQDKYHI